MQWSAKRVWEKSEADAASTISRLAANNDLTELATPTYTHKGKDASNDYYLRPDRSIMYAKWRPSDVARQAVDAKEIFTQVIACRSISRGEKSVPYTDPSISEQERRKMFDEAVLVTGRILTAYYAEQSSFCGDRCENLTSTGMSREISENFADWIATRSLWRYLARTPAGEERRSASAVLGTSFCESAGGTRSFPDLAHSEARFSMRPHPSDARRRNSIFDEVSAQLVGCRLEPERLDSYGTCEP